MSTKSGYSVPLVVSSVAALGAFALAIATISIPQTNYALLGTAWAMLAVSVIARAIWNPNPKIFGLNNDRATFLGLPRGAWVGIRIASIAGVLIAAALLLLGYGPTQILLGSSVIAILVLDIAQKSIAQLTKQAGPSK